MKLRVWFLVLILLVPGMVLAQNVPDPYKAVKEATDKLLDKLAQVQPLYKTDPGKFYREIKTSLAPFIDYDGFARGVMAKYYRRASPEQRAKFAEKFQQELIETYSSALVQFDNQKVEVLPPDQPAEDGRAAIELKVYANDGTVYPVSYTLAFVDNTWKLRNVVVNGINIGLQFRSQFANYMQKYHGDIDAVIDNWNVDKNNA